MSEKDKSKKKSKEKEKEGDDRQSREKDRSNKRGSKILRRSLSRLRGSNKEESDEKEEAVGGGSEQAGILKIPVLYIIEIIEIYNLSSEYAGTKCQLSWRRGTKKENRGKFPKKNCTATGKLEIGQTIKFMATIKQNLQKNIFNEKTIAFVLKKEKEGSIPKKKQTIGSIILDLSKYAKAMNQSSGSEVNLPLIKSKKNKILKIKITSVLDCSREDNDVQDDSESGDVSLRNRSRSKTRKRAGSSSTRRAVSLTSDQILDLNTQLQSLYDSESEDTENDILNEDDDPEADAGTKEDPFSGSFDMQMPSLLKKSTRNLKTLVSVPSTPLKASQRQREIEKQKKLAEKWIMKGAEGKTNIIEDLNDDGTIKVLNADHCLPLSDIQERQLREISLKDFHIPIGKELEEIEKRKRQDRIRYEEVRSKINLLYEKFDKADLEVAKAQLRLEEAQIKLLEYENQFIKEQKQQISQLNGIIETNNKKQILEGEKGVLSKKENENTAQLQSLLAESRTYQRQLEKLQGSFSLLSPSLLLVFSPLLSFSYLPFSPSHISPPFLLISPLLSFSYLPSLLSLLSFRSSLLSLSSTPFLSPLFFVILFFLCLSPPSFLLFISYPASHSSLFIFPAPSLLYRSFLLLFFSFAWFTCYHVVPCIYLSRGIGIPPPLFLLPPPLPLLVNYFPLKASLPLSPFFLLLLLLSFHESRVVPK